MTDDTMIATAIDAQGHAHDLPLAEKDCIVLDHENQPRQLVKGQPVPLHLLEAYEVEVGKGKSKAVKAPEKDKAQRAPDVDK